MIRKGRILVVDDDESVLRSLSLVLKDAGYVVDTAETGKEAIDKSETNVYNLAIIDVRLPDMEGTKLLTTMRDAAREMTRIVLTGYPTFKNMAEATIRGADGYLIKPVDMNTLLKTVDEYLRKRHHKNRRSRKRDRAAKTQAKELRASA